MTQTTEAKTKETRGEDEISNRLKVRKPTKRSYGLPRYHWSPSRRLRRAGFERTRVPAGWRLHRTDETLRAAAIAAANSLDAQVDAAVDASHPMGPMDRGLAAILRAAAMLGVIGARLAWDDANVPKRTMKVTVESEPSMHLFSQRMEVLRAVAVEENDARTTKDLDQLKAIMTVIGIGRPLTVQATIADVAEQVAADIATHPEYVQEWLTFEDQRDDGKPQGDGRCD